MKKTALFKSPSESVPPSRPAEAKAQPDKKRAVQGKPTRTAITEDRSLLPHIGWVRAQRTPPNTRTVALLYMSPMHQRRLRPHQLQKEGVKARKQRTPLSISLQEQAGKAYQEALARALKGCQAEDPDLLSRSFQLLGPLLLEEHEVLKKITEWWLAAQKGDKSAKGNLQKALCGLTWAGSGRYETRSPEEKRDIALVCLSWLPKFQKLSKVLRKLKDCPAWQQTSREEREAITNKLAREHAVSVKEVQIIRRYFTGTGTRSGWVTPEKATFELVAGLFRSRAGTVEKIYRDFSRDSPHLKKT